MSLYEVGRLIHRFNVDDVAIARWREAPAAVLADYALDDTERQALLAGDLPALWRMGVHPLMMLHYARAQRVPMPEFYGQLRPLAGERRLASARGG